VILAAAATAWQIPPGAGFAYKRASPNQALLTKRLASGKYRLDEDGELEKLCTKCKEYWPADTEFFYPNSGDLDGIWKMCKACYQEWRKSHRHNAAKQQHGND